jgi:hypothetical protein
MTDKKTGGKMNTQRRNVVVGLIVLGLIMLCCLSVGFLGGGFGLWQTFSGRAEKAEIEPTQRPEVVREEVEVTRVVEREVTRVVEQPEPTVPPTQEEDDEPVVTTEKSECPTTAEAKEAIGIDVQRLATEPCAFVWRGSDKAEEVAVCPAGWICTLHVQNAGVFVYDGYSKSDGIVAGTFRMQSGYPSNDAVNDRCELFRKEQAFGASETPAFEVEPGNFSCP